MTRPQRDALPSGREEMSREVRGEFLMPCRRDEMLPSNVDEMSKALSTKGGRVKECKPECHFILHQGDLNASSPQNYPMEGRGKECKPKCRFILPQGDPNTSPSQNLYRKLHMSPKSNTQNVAMAGNA